MRLTSFTDVGLRSLMKIAGEPGRAHSTTEIADAYRISRNSALGSAPLFVQQ